MSVSIEHLPGGRFEYEDDPMAYIQRETLEMQHDRRQILLERRGDIREGHSWDNPNGVTVIPLNGLFETAEDWRPFAKRFCRESAEAGVDMTVLAVKDPHYYSQADYTGTAVATAKSVKQVAADGHTIWLLGHSRGGITAAQAGVELLREDIVVGGVKTWATPMGGVDLSPMHLVKDLYKELAEIPHWVHEPRLVALYGAIGIRAVERMMRHGPGLAREVRGIISAAKPDDMVALSRYGKPDEIVTSAAYYGNDGIINEKLNISRLEIGKFAGRTLKLHGNHVTGLVDPASRAELLEDIKSKFAQSELDGRSLAG